MYNLFLIAPIYFAIDILSGLEPEEKAAAIEQVEIKRKEPES